MTRNTLVGRDLYVRTKSPGKAPIITLHRVWDAERFLAAQQHEAVERARKDKTDPDTVTSATADEYRRARH